MSYLNTAGLQTLWNKIKSFSKSNYLRRDNIGKYAKLTIDGYTYSAPKLSISTSDTNWHSLSFVGDSKLISEGDLLASELFTVSSSVFTCVVPGVYAVDASILYSSDTTGAIGWIHIKNGTYSGVKHVGVSYWYPPSSGSHNTVSANVSTVLTLDVGDTIEIEAARGAGGAVKITGAFLSIVCLADLSDPNKYTKIVTDLHIAPRSAWNSGTTPALSSSNAEYACGVETANNYSFTDRNSKLFYLMPVNSMASKVSITLNDRNLTNYKISYTGYKVVNGSLSRIFQTGYVTDLMKTWVAGEIDYITIHVQNVEGTSFAWTYSPENITVKFTNY